MPRRRAYTGLLVCVPAQRGVVYSAVGGADSNSSILVALNPLSMRPIYSRRVLEQYRDGKT